MKLLRIILICLLASSTAMAEFGDFRVVSGVNYDKLINDNAGMEFLFKSSVSLSDDFQVKLGLSEGFTAPRSTPYSMNHNGRRFDVGCEWRFLNNYWFTYTHSGRNYFDGANPTNVYDYNSVDTIGVRVELQGNLMDMISNLK